MLNKQGRGRDGGKKRIMMEYIKHGIEIGYSLTDCEVRCQLGKGVARSPWGWRRL